MEIQILGVSKNPKTFPFAFHPPSKKVLTFLSYWALQKPSSKLRRSGPAGRNKLYPAEMGEQEKLPRSTAVPQLE